MMTEEKEGIYDEENQKAVIPASRRRFGGADGGCCMGDRGGRNAHGL
ncbi:MAG: hypothetical protein HFF10_02740 [Angelakisella sp.]|nr:hypothetical protein [Angelakisella sp.]